MSDNTQQAKQIQLQSKEEKTLYNTSYFGIFFRNFIAGFARTLGALIMYMLFIYFIGAMFAAYVYPEIEPLLESFQSIGDLSSQLQSGSGQTVTVDPETAQQILENNPELQQQIEQTQQEQ